MNKIVACFFIALGFLTITAQATTEIQKNEIVSFSQEAHSLAETLRSVGLTDQQILSACEKACQKPTVMHLKKETNFWDVLGGVLKWTVITSVGGAAIIAAAIILNYHNLSDAELRRQWFSFN